LKEHVRNHKGLQPKLKNKILFFKKEIISKSDAIFLENKIKKRGTKVSERY
jgi:hypothetical protein